MRLRYAPQARRDLEAIHAHIAGRSPEAAARVIAAIRAACELLAEFPAIGRDTDMAGVRVLPVARFSYLLYHHRHNDTLVIVHIRHTTRDAAH